MLPGTITCCELAVESAEEGQLLYVNPHMLGEGLEVQGGVNAVDNGRVMVLAKNKTVHLVTLSAGTACGNATAISEYDLELVPSSVPEIRCREVSCQPLAEGDGSSEISLPAELQAMVDRVE